MLTGQNGILNRASESKNKTQVTNEKEAISLAAMEALTEGKGTITVNNLKASMKSYLGKEVELIGNGPWQYQGTDGAYTITEEGSVAKGWICIYDANGAPEQVTNGKMTLNIGDYINYNPVVEGVTYTSPAGTVQATTYKVKETNEDSAKIRSCAEAAEYQKLINERKVVPGNGKLSQNYSSTDASNIKWRILGADEETGELLIVVTDKVNDLTLTGITGYLYGKDELNKICNVYGKGKGATGGRSITLDDVNKVIGKEGGTRTDEYTYTWTKNSLDKKAPSYDGGTNYLRYYHVKMDTTTNEPGTTGIFNYYNSTTKKWETNTKELSEFEGTETITTLKPDFMGYSSISEAQTKTKGYNVVFKNGSGGNIEASNRYWLSSSYEYADAGFAAWGMYFMYADSYVNGYNMYYSFGLVNVPTCGVRPVVSLKSDIQLEISSSTADSTTYDIK